MSLWGVATHVYGRGHEVTVKFETEQEAREYATAAGSSAVPCRFSDGRWRKLA